MRGSFPLIVVTFFCATWTMQSGDAQDYEVLPLAPQFDIKQIQNEPAISGDPKKAAAELRRRKSEQAANKRSVFLKGQSNPMFQAYYEKVTIPELTRYDRDSLKDLPNKRQAIMKEFSRSIRNPGIRAFLIKDIFFPELSKIVDGNFHPAVRYNALIMLGDLDEVAGKDRSTPPRPYREVLPFLLAQYQKLSDSKLQYLKYGAFRGIVRIASLDAQQLFIPAEQRTQVKSVLDALMGPMPAGLAAELFAAMQRQAVKVIGLYGAAADADAIAKLITDPAISYWTRLEAAIAFSKLKVASVDAGQLEAVGKSVAQLMHDVLVDEVSYLDYHQNRIAILAARAAEISGGSVSSGGKRSGAGSSSSSGGGGDRSGLTGSAGGASPDSGGGASPGAGGMSPSSGSGGGSSGGGRSGSSFGGSEDGGLAELPAYRIEIARRRIKTISSGLFRSFGSPADPSGLMRWAKGETLKKLSEIKGALNEADLASEAGMNFEDDGSEEGQTEVIRSQLKQAANKLAGLLGIAPEPDEASKEGEAEVSGDGFLDN